MKLLWVLLFMLITINAINARSLQDHEEDKNITNVKPTNNSSYRNILASRRSIGLFPSLQRKENNFKGKPKPKINEDETKRPYNRTSLMRKLQINRHQKHVSKEKVEVTSRKPVMRIMRFTTSRRPYQFYPKTVPEVTNRKNRRISTFNLGRQNRSLAQSEPKLNINNETSPANRFNNIKNVGMSIDGDSSEEIDEDDQNSYVAAGSRKSKAFLLPEKNIKRYLKMNSNQEGSVKTNDFIQIPKHISGKNNGITQIEPTSTDHKDAVKLPKDNDQEKIDPEELILLKRSNQTDEVTVEPSILVNEEEISTDRN